MNYRDKKVTGSNLPDRWMVQVIYRGRSSPTIFTIEALEDIDEFMELSQDWIAITLNRYGPKPAPDPNVSPTDRPPSSRRPRVPFALVSPRRTDLRAPSGRRP